STLLLLQEVPRIKTLEIKIIIIFFIIRNISEVKFEVIQKYTNVYIICNAKVVFFISSSYKYVFLGYPVQRTNSKRLHIKVL
ncbi:MAG TPA: hypothetical protein VFC87_05345, partial [Perlabentimonas sp.]|nr:hypothetical protein [Perlabentimonas sp.]